MNFREGLNYVYKNRSSDLELTDPFVLYCRLSDLCGSSFEDKRKVGLFYQIDKKINVVQAILNNDFEIKNKYFEVAELLSEESFYALINTVKNALDSNYIEQAKPKPQKQAAVQAVVTKTEEPEVEETRTPLTSSYMGGRYIDVIIGHIIGGVLLAIVLFIVFACVFNWPWAVWQWFVGIVGGGVLFVSLAFAVWWLDEECLIDYYVLGTLVLGACVLLNFILLLIFRENYKTIFSWISGFEVVSGGILAFITFDDIEEGWGVAQIIEIVLTIIFFIIAMVWI